MSKNVYVLSLGAAHRRVNEEILYVGEHISTYSLGAAKTFPSKYWLILCKIFSEKYRYWDIVCHSKKAIFEARLKGK